MEFHEKLQELRRKKGLTQEELARALYVSRTAVSKWESGRGYPSIDSLREIASFFSVTLDSLLSTDEALTVAEGESLERMNRTRDTVFGLMDLCLSLLFFLPLFAIRSGDGVRSVSLFALTVSPYLKVLSVALLALTVGNGILTLALRSLEFPFWNKMKTPLSLSLGAVLSLLLTVSMQPYPAVFCFVLLAVKVIVLTRNP
jgi:transcriptional regulator with XRE-family HTH domain